MFSAGILSQNNSAIAALSGFLIVVIAFIFQLFVEPSYEGIWD